MNATVNATGGGGYGLSLSAGGNATANLNITVAGSIVSNVTALGGSGNGLSFNDYGGNATATNIAAASGGSGSVIANSFANAGYGSSLYTTESATSIADASRSTGSATAISTAGYAGTFQYAGTAISKATAITANGKTAIAEATGDHLYTGQADVTATTSDGIIEKLTASADTPVLTNGATAAEDAPGSAQAEVDGGTAYTAEMGSYDSYAFAGGLAAYKTLGVNVGAVFKAPATQDLRTGTLGYNANPNSTSPQTYTSSISWELNPSTLTGNTLDLGLVEAIAKGNNFSNLTFMVTLQVSTVSLKLKIPAVASPAERAWSHTCVYILHFSMEIVMSITAFGQADASFW